MPPDANRPSVWVHHNPRFDLAGILPGSYTMRASCNQRRVSRQADLDVDVVDRDVEGLVLRFPEGAQVRGILHGVGEPGGIQISLADRETQMQVAGAMTARDATFTLEQVAPGSYRLRTGRGPAGRIPQIGAVWRGRSGGPAPLKCRTLQAAAFSKS